MKNILVDIRWNKSPFTLGVLSGIGAIGLDFIWAAAEVLKILAIIDGVFVVHIILLIGFPICAVILIHSLVIYVKQGYARRERIDEMQYQLDELKVKCGLKADGVNKSVRRRSPFINN